MNILRKKVSDDFFEISFALNETNKNLKLITPIGCINGEDYKVSYTEQSDIDSILSHLTTIDEVKMKNKIKSGDFKSEMIEFNIIYGVNGKKVSEKLSVPLGYGHFEKGINYLRDNFSQSLGLLNSKDRNAINSDELRTRLDNKCKGFKKPVLDMADLQKAGYGTIDVCVETAKALSNEELGAFLQGFQQYNDRKSNGKSNGANKDELIKALAEKLSVEPKELTKSIKELIDNESIKQESNKEKQLVENIQKESTNKEQKSKQVFKENPQVTQEAKETLIKKASEIAIKIKKDEAVDKTKIAQRSKINPPLSKDR